MTAFAPLFEPFRLGNVTLPNRIAMAPMTRQFSPERVPGENVAEYYQRRAAGGTCSSRSGSATSPCPTASPWRP